MVGIAVEDTEAPRQGIGLVAHPHPLLGGTMDNKVVHTLTRAFVRLGYRMFRANFRGVGQSGGEQDDLLTVIEHMRAQPACAQLPLILAGFSFGALCSRMLHNAWRNKGWPRSGSSSWAPRQAAGRWRMCQRIRWSFTVNAMMWFLFPLCMIGRVLKSCP